MDPDKKGDSEPKRLNEELVDFMSKRSRSEVPHFTVQLKKYINVREKRNRAAISRKNSEMGRQLRGLPGKRGGSNSAPHDGEPTDKSLKENRDDESDNRKMRRRSHHARSRSGSAEPKDRCGCRRRRRRRRSCRRRRRRRSCGRRRRRSRCRRRRRRSRCRRRRRSRCRRRRRC